MNAAATVRRSDGRSAGDDEATRLCRLMIVRCLKREENGETNGGEWREKMENGDQK